MSYIGRKRVSGQKTQKPDRSLASFGRSPRPRTDVLFDVVYRSGLLAQATAASFAALRQATAAVTTYCGHVQKGHFETRFELFHRQVGLNLLAEW